MKEIIRQAIDLHVHVGPEIIPRRFTVRTLVESEQGKLAGVAVKSHFFSTAPAVKEVKSDMNVIASVTLNNYVGGLNEDAIYAAAQLTGQIIVWFPTINAENYLRKSKYEIRPEWIDNFNIKLRMSTEIKPVRMIGIDDVLKAIKETDSILATGHISWQETKMLVDKAIEIGIRKIIVTHPIYPLIDMPLDVQKELAEKGAYIEQCYSMWAIDKIAIEKIVKQIKVIGADNCIMSSDVGQVFSKTPSEALEEFASLLAKNGITEKEIKTMCVDNPRKLIFRKN